MLTQNIPPLQSQGSSSTPKERRRGSTPLWEPRPLFFRLLIPYLTAVEVTFELFSSREISEEARALVERGDLKMESRSTYLLKRAERLALSILLLVPLINLLFLKYAIYRTEQALGKDIPHFLSLFPPNELRRAKRLSLQEFLSPPFHTYILPTPTVEKIAFCQLSKEIILREHKIASKGKELQSKDELSLTRSALLTIRAITRAEFSKSSSYQWMTQQLPTSHVQEVVKGKPKPLAPIEEIEEPSIASGSPSQSSSLQDPSGAPL